jgi:hypothetical protein
MGVELLILTIYFICVVYVLYQMALSVEAKLEDQFEIVLDGDSLKAAIANQLQQQTLYHAEPEVHTEKGDALLKLTFRRQDDPVGAVGIQVKPTGKQPLEPPIRTLSVAIVNTLPDQQVLVNWDYSTLSVYGGPAQRVIRQVPGQPTDLLQAQVYTAVNPGLQSSVAVTSEGMLQRPDNQVALEVGTALIDFNKIPMMKEPMRQYSLQMLVWVRSMIDPNSPPLQLLVPFVFRIKILPDHVALPVLSWLLNFNPFTVNPFQKSR